MGKGKVEEQCLLLRTSDRREFFTDVNNYPMLIEFAKNHKAELAVVKPTTAVKVLTLSELAQALCQPAAKKDPCSFSPDYEVVEIRISERVGAVVTTRSRQQILAQAGEIRGAIEEDLLAGKVVSLEELQERFAACQLSEASLRKHLTFVRIKMANAGKAVGKVGVASYQLLGK
jgi:hypothetical protein